MVPLFYTLKMKFIRHFIYYFSLLNFFTIVLFSCKQTNKDKIVEYFDNGNISLEYTTIDGKKEGEFIRYTSDGKISSVYHFENDLQHGKSVHYYRNGQINEIQHYIKGKKTLTDTILYENGNFKMLIDYSDDKKHGRLRKYNVNGSIHFEARYQSDTLVEVNGKPIIE